MMKHLKSRDMRNPPLTIKDVKEVGSSSWVNTKIAYIAERTNGDRAPEMVLEYLHRFH
jgi:hypothetical protein